jgi:hypothetical protein
MARIKENQEAMDRGEWNALPDQQRQELENTFRHTGQIARYTNIMGIKTVSVDLINPPPTCLHECFLILVNYS